MRIRAPAPQLIRGVGRTLGRASRDRVWAMAISLTNVAGVAADEYEDLSRVVAEHRGLDDIFAWGRRQTPPIHPADVVKQDEFTHDVLVPFPRGRWVIYGTT